MPRLCAKQTSTIYTPHMITDEYMDDLLYKIGQLSDRFEETGNRMYYIMMEAMVNSYEAKLKLKMQDEQV